MTTAQVGDSLGGTDGSQSPRFFPVVSGAHQITIGAVTVTCGIFVLLKPLDPLFLPKPEC